jgi:hypothetical protein
MLGEDNLKLMTQLINSIYVTGEWPRDFIEVTMNTLKKKKYKPKKCSDHRTKLLRIISERNLDMLHRLAEGILSCQLDQINADPKENWDRLVRKKIDQHIVVGPDC